MLKNATRQLYVDVFGEPRTYESEKIPDVAEALKAREIQVPASDNSEDSYSATIENTPYVEYLLKFADSLSFQLLLNLIFRILSFGNFDFGTKKH